jgi:hypothetical protein
MRLVSLGVRNPCFLQQMRAGARLAFTRGIHSRVPKTSRQEPYSESTVWVMTISCCLFKLKSDNHEVEVRHVQSEIEIWKRSYDARSLNSEICKTGLKGET